MLGVLIFAAIPMLDVELTDMEYHKPALRCTDTRNHPRHGNRDHLRCDAGHHGRPDRVYPLWWAMLHWLSQAVTAASVAAIPCSYDVASVDYRLAEANLEDPVLNQELEQFKNDCWQPAYSRLSRTNLASLTQAEKEDATWLGSEYLLGSGLYDRYYSTVPNPQFCVRCDPRCGL